MVDVNVERRSCSNAWNGLHNQSAALYRLVFEQAGARFRSRCVDERSELDFRIIPAFFSTAHAHKRGPLLRDYDKGKASHGTSRFND